MKVLVADKFETSGLDALKQTGFEVAYEPDAKDDSLLAAIPSSGADVLVVRSTAVTGAMLEAGRLSLVVRAGAGDYLLPLVFDNCAGFDAGQNEILRSEFQTANLDDCLLDDVGVCQFSNRAVWLDDAGGDIFDLCAVQKLDADLALLIAAALGKDLDADVVAKCKFLY